MSVKKPKSDPSRRTDSRPGRYWAATIGLEALWLVACLLVALVAALTMVPQIVVLVQGASGITLADRVELVVAGWILPSLFLIGLLFVAVLRLCRFIRLYCRSLRATARGSLFVSKTDSTKKGS